MTKINDDMIRAIKARKDWQKSNTKVLCLDDRLLVYLHDNLICQYFYNTKVVISHCGYTTNVTKSRLNAILRYFELPTITQLNWDWYINGQVWYTQFSEYATSK